MKIRPRKSEITLLKERRVPLTPEERQIVMDHDAVWHPGGGPHAGSRIPAVWKSKHPQTGMMTFVTNTHRAYKTARTLKGAINHFHNGIKQTA